MSQHDDELRTFLDGVNLLFRARSASATTGGEEMIDGDRYAGEANRGVQRGPLRPRQD